MLAKEQYVKMYYFLSFVITLKFDFFTNNFPFWGHPVYTYFYPKRYWLIFLLQIIYGFVWFNLVVFVLGKVCTKFYVLSMEIKQYPTIYNLLCRHLFTFFYTMKWFTILSGWGGGLCIFCSKYLYGR